MDRIAEFINESLTSIPLSVNIEYIYFDLEITGLNLETVEICQVAAKINLKEAFIKSVNISRHISDKRSPIYFFVMILCFMKINK